MAVLAGLYHLAHLKRVGNRSILVYGTALILSVFSPFFVKSELAFAPGIQIPPEQKLWQELYTYPGINRVSHFYSDNDFTHEIFAMRPQRIIADPTLLKNDGFLRSLIEKGNCPIVITRVGTNQDLMMGQSYRQVGLYLRRITDNRFNLYYQDCFLDPFPID